MLGRADLKRGVEPPEQRDILTALPNRFVEDPVKERAFLLSVAAVIVIGVRMFPVCVPDLFVQYVLGGLVVRAAATRGGPSIGLGLRRN